MFQTHEYARISSAIGSSSDSFLSVLELIGSHEPDKEFTGREPGANIHGVSIHILHESRF